MPPFFTIITSTYNAAATLPRLLDSLASQTCRDFNWIVQDGASSDATMQIVEQYRDRLPEILADSGRDKGIYDAWNKAIDRWQDKMGEWILFLGADDRLASKDILAKVQERISNLPEDIIFAAGDMIYLDEEGEAYSSFAAPHNDVAFTQRFRGMPVPHTALFTRKSTIQHKFDASFRIAGDFDFMLREFRTPAQLKQLDFLITYMGYGGISTNTTTRNLGKKEMLFTVKKYSFYHFILFKFNHKKSHILTNFKNYLLQSKFGTSVFRILKKIKIGFFK